MSQKRASSDAPRALRAGELRDVMDAIRGGPQEDPPGALAADDLDDASRERSVESSGIFRVVEPPHVDENAAELEPVSSAPPALRPDRLSDVLARLAPR